MTYNQNDGIFNAYYGNPASSPAMYAQGISSPDFNSLLESFTNPAYASDDSGNGSFGQQTATNYLQPSGSGPAFPYTAFGSAGQSPKSEPFSGFSANGPAADRPAFGDGLNIHQDHFKAKPAPPPSSYLTEQPTASTVSRLEEAAALQPPSVTAHQSYTGGIGRQSRSSTLSDGVHIASLSLDSPRHSLSASSASSAQSSPATPMSGFALDGSGQSFALQQQRSMSQMAQNAMTGKYFGPSHITDANPLSASLPPSYVHHTQQMQDTYQYQHYPLTTVNPLSRSVASAPLVQSPSRMSNAGLMDQVVNSRRALASPLSNDIDSFPSGAGVAKKASKKHGRSRSGTSASPPLTPARSALRASKRSGAAGEIDTTTPSGNGQTPSQVGPCRTPAKISASSTPKRPDLRRTASHTPHGSRTASPAGPPNAAHLARLAGGGVELDFAGSSSMSRAASSPGWALGASQPRPSSSSSSLASSASSSAPSRRSSQAAGLLMSPLPHEGPHSASALPAPSAQMPISHAQALGAVTQLRLYLAQQAAILQTIPPQPAATVVGTYEQAQAVDDLHRRISGKTV